MVARSLGEENRPRSISRPSQRGSPRLRFDRAISPSSRLQIPSNFNESSASSTQRMDGVFDRLLRGKALDQLALEVAGKLGQRPGRSVSSQPFDGAGRQCQHAVAPLPANASATTSGTSSLSHGGHRKDCPRSRLRSSAPGRSAATSRRFGTRTQKSCRSHGKNDVVERDPPGKDRGLAVGNRNHPDIGELELPPVATHPSRNSPRRACRPRAQRATTNGRISIAPCRSRLHPTPPPRQSAGCRRARV